MKKILSIIFAMMFLLIPVSAFADTETYSEEKGIPTHYFDECPVHGTINVDTFQHMNGGNDTLLVWTPYDYDESGNTKYEVILLLHGGGGTLHDWMDTKFWVCIDAESNRLAQTVQMSNIYDWISYEKKCKPFIVVTLNNRQDREYVSREMIKALSFVAENYQTYAEDGLEEHLIAARDHFTVGGLSNGATTVFYFLSHYLEYAGNYIVFSMMRDRATNDLSFQEEVKEMKINSYFGGAGIRDKYNHANFGPADEQFYGEYANRSAYIIYPWGHDWSTWTHGIYDALVYTIGAEPENTANHAVKYMLKLFKMRFI